MNQPVSEELLRDLSIRGFDALFESAATEPADTLVDSTTWTLRAASEKLGLSPNTIRKRIRTGELHADKIIGHNGPEWRIQPPIYSTGNGAAVTGADTGAGIENSAANPSAFIGTTAIAENNLPAFGSLLKVIETQAKQLEAATTQLAVSTEQVKAAIRVIAYQQLQLEEKDSKVKLLTDSRHHEGWLKKLVHRLKLG